MPHSPIQAPAKKPVSRPTPLRPGQVSGAQLYADYAPGIGGQSAWSTPEQRLQILMQQYMQMSQAEQQDLWQFRSTGGMQPAFENQLNQVWAGLSNNSGATNPFLNGSRAGNPFAQPTRDMTGTRQSTMSDTGLVPGTPGNPGLWATPGTPGYAAQQQPLGQTLYPAGSKFTNQPTVYGNPLVLGAGPFETQLMNPNTTTRGVSGGALGAAPPYSAMRGEPGAPRNIGAYPMGVTPQDPYTPNPLVNPSTLTSGQQPGKPGFASAKMQPSGGSAPNPLVNPSTPSESPMLGGPTGPGEMTWGQASELFRQPNLFSFTPNPVNSYAPPAGSAMFPAPANAGRRRAVGTAQPQPRRANPLY